MIEVAFRACRGCYKQVMNDYVNELRPNDVTFRVSFFGNKVSPGSTNDDTVHSEDCNVITSSNLRLYRRAEKREEQGLPLTTRDIQILSDMRNRNLRPENLDGDDTGPVESNVSLFGG